MKMRSIQVGGAIAPRIAAGGHALEPTGRNWTAGEGAHRSEAASVQKFGMISRTVENV